jgi:F0F1-type ATP synthase assembly protein I
MPRKINWAARAGAYMGLVWVLPVAMAVCWFAGDYADKRLGTTYWSMAGLIVGFAAGLYETLRQANRIENGP